MRLEALSSDVLWSQWLTLRHPNFCRHHVRRPERDIVESRSLGLLSEGSITRRAYRIIALVNPFIVNNCNLAVTTGKTDTGGNAVPPEFVQALCRKCGEFRRANPRLPLALILSM